MKNRKVRLICMSFDGEYKGEGIHDIEQVWEYANDLGSKWFFYPFYFLTTASGKTIIDTPARLGFLYNLRTETVVKIFKHYSQLPEAANMNCDQFINLLSERDNN